MRDAVHGEGVEPDFFFHDKMSLSPRSRAARPPRDVEHHRDHIVISVAISVHRYRVHDARFAELFQRPPNASNCLLPIKRNQSG
jgi:hypothetical protein